MRFQCARQFLTFGFWHGDVVFDIHGVEHLAAETLAHQAGTNPFTRRVNRRCRTRRAGADNQHVVHVTFVQLICRTFLRAGIDFGYDFGQRHSPLAELFTVHINRRNAHHVAIGDFILEYAAVDGRVFNTRVKHRHQVQGLHHVRTVVARERIVGFELKITVDLAYLLKQRLRFFRRMSAGPQQRQHQRSKLMAQRRASKARPLVRTRIGNQK
ncbi:hypothetical protein D3C71_1043720 [compost metagenome]